METETILIQIPDGGDMTKALVGDFTAICGTGPTAYYAGNLLYRMMFLHDRSEVVLDGKRWYIQSREELMRDLGLSLHMYKTALAKLKELEFVEVTYTQSLKKQAALRTTAFRVTEKARCAVLERTNHPTGQATVLPTGGTTVLPTGQQTRLPTIELEDINSSDSVVIGARKNALRKSEAYRSKKSSGRVKQKDVEEVWREGVKAFDSGYYHAPWFNREQAMAKRLIKAVGEDRVLEVVRQCTTRWPEFVAEAEKSSKYHFTQRPNLGALLAHASAALSFATKPSYVHVQQGAKKSLKDYPI
jgi:hypothetical protein